MQIISLLVREKDSLPPQVARTGVDSSSSGGSRRNLRNIVGIYETKSSAHLAFTSVCFDTQISLLLLLLLLFCFFFFFIPPLSCIC